jgi:hypothetical protein
MKILEQTPKRLVFYSRPIGLCLFVAIFPIVGLLIGIFFIDFNSFSCKRQGVGNDLCQKSKVSALGNRTTQIPLDELISAEVKRKYDREGTLYRVEINSKQGSIPLREVWEGGDNTQSQDRITYQINSFLRNKQQKSISINLYPSAILLIWFFLWMPLSTLAFLAVAQIRICTFDKNLHKLKIERKGLIGQKTSEYPLEEISDVIISPEGLEGNSIPANPVYVVLNSGQKLPVYLALDSLSNNDEWQQKAHENINLIKTFLGFSK